MTERASTTTQAPRSGVDRYFKITERASTVGREIRGGVVTYFTMAYIVVLNPLIIGTQPDATGEFLGGGEAPNLGMVAAATALVAGVMTIAMGAFANYPLALATGLGLNAFVIFSIASQMTWADAMGLVVIEGLIILVLVLTGLRESLFNAIPLDLKIAISVGIGLFIALIGLVDGGVVRRTAAPPVPVELGIGGRLGGWPVLVFAVVFFGLVVLWVLKVKGAILWAILGGTVLAILVEAAFDIGPSFGADGTVNPRGWGLNAPSFPDSIVDTPDFGLLGQFSLLGGWREVGILTAGLFVFTLLLADFFDTMGTMVALGAEGDLLDETGKPPNTQRILVVDSVAAAAGGAASVSSNTSYIESAAGVGDGGADRARQHCHGYLLPADDIPRAAGRDRSVRGSDARPGAGRVPDDGPGQGNRLGRRRDRPPGVPDHRVDAVHLFDRGGDRRRFPRLCVDQAGARKGSRRAPHCYGPPPPCSSSTS